MVRSQSPDAGMKALTDVELDLAHVGSGAGGGGHRGGDTAQGEEELRRGGGRAQCCSLSVFTLSSAREGRGETGAGLVGHWGKGMAQCCAVPCCVQSLQVSLPTSTGAGAGHSTAYRSASLPTCRYWMPLISPTPWYTKRAGSLRSLLHLQAVVAGGGGRESGRRREKQDAEVRSVGKMDGG